MKGTAVSLALVFVSACASKGPPAAAPVDSGTKPSTDVVVPVVDLSPVAKPADWVVLGRLSRPRQLVEKVASWAGVPVRLTDLLPSGARSLEKVVAWDAPVEVVASLDPRTDVRLAPPLGVISVGVTSIDAALQAARERDLNPEPISTGVYRVRMTEELSCALGAAVGAAPARLVCGGDWRSVETLLPYATRGLPLEDLGQDDLRLVARAEPLQSRYGQEIGSIRLLASVLLRRAQTDNQRLDRALTDAAYGLADELKVVAMELDRLELRAKLDEPGNALDLGYGLSFAKKGSWFAQLLDDMGKRSAPPSDVFWELPRDAHSAGSSVGSDPKRFEPIEESLTEIADAYLEQRKSPTAFRVRVRGLVAGFSNLLSGNVESTVWQPAVKGGSRSDVFAHSLGLHVGVLEQRADVLTAWLAEAAAALSDPELKRIGKDLLDVDLAQAQRPVTRPARVPGFAAVGKSIRFDVPPSWIDRRKGSGQKPATKSVPVVVVVVPDGERSWVAFGTDEKALLGRLEAVKNGQAGKLSERTELLGLKQKPSYGAGFYTLESLLMSFAGAARGAGGIAEAAVHAPNRGKSPWLLTMTETPAGSGLRVDGVLRVPRGAIEDAASLAPLLMSLGN